MKLGNIKCTPCVLKEFVTLIESAQGARIVCLNQELISGYPGYLYIIAIESPLLPEYEGDGPVPQYDMVIEKTERGTLIKEFRRVDDPR